MTLVNVVAEGARISALVDINPHKQGRFAPSTGTPVVGRESLRGRPAVDHC
ncbi:MAG: SAM-dependent methyltransferase, partial [Mesorhizobium sp.]